MQEVRDKDQLLKVISDFRASHENIVGNLTVAKREMEKVISQARLFYKVYQHTLVVFQDEHDYWQITLLTDGIEEKINLPHGKPYASTVLNASQEENSRLILMEKFISMNIYPVATYSAYKLNVRDSYVMAKDIADSMCQTMDMKGYKIIPYQREYADEIHAFWNQYLERYNYRMDEWDLESYGKNDLLLLFDTNFPKPKLIATVYMIKTGASYISGGFAVEPKYRHEMIGVYMQALINCRAYEEGVSTLNAWIRDGNKRAIKLNEIFGMRKTLLRFQQYYSQKSI